VHLAPQHFIFDDLTAKEALELVKAASEDVDFHLVAFTNGGQILVDSTLTCLDFGVLGFALLHLSNLRLKVFMDTSELELHFLFKFVLLREHFLLEVREVLVTALFVYPGDQVCGEVDDLLELLSLQFFLGFGTHEEVRKP